MDIFSHQWQLRKPALTKNTMTIAMRVFHYLITAESVMLNCENSIKFETIDDKSLISWK